MFLLKKAYLQNYGKYRSRRSLDSIFCSMEYIFVDRLLDQITQKLHGTAITFSSFPFLSLLLLLSLSFWLDLALVTKLGFLVAFYILLKTDGIVLDSAFTSLFCFQTRYFCTIVFHFSQIMFDYMIYFLKLD